MSDNDESTSNIYLKIKEIVGPEIEGLWEELDKETEWSDTYWATAIINDHQLGPMLGAEGRECMRFLKDVDLEEHSLFRWSVQLHFGENPYFTNEVLSKANTNRFGVENTTINWKEGKSLQNTAFFEWFSARIEGDDPEIDSIVSGFWIDAYFYRVLDQVKKERDGDGTE